MENNNTKYIDKYISEELSTEEKAKFEQALKTDKELQKEYELQLQITSAANRLAIRSDVQAIAKSYHFLKLVKWIAGSVIALTIVGLGIYALMDKNDDTNIENPTPEPIETSVLSEKELIQNLPREVFTWEGKDSVFLSKEGVIVSIPNDAFLLNGKPYNGEALIEWQEATDGATIMKSGLSTMADDELLETQGMFSFRAQTKDGELLDVNEDVGIYVQVPVDEIKPGMQLYDGEYNADSIINWVNPIPLAKIPVPVPMDSLDFYPKGYEDTLNKLKLSQRKEYRDSLYLACEVKETPLIPEEFYPSVQENDNEEIEVDDIGLEADTLDVSATFEATEEFNHIPPSKVLAFWNSKFDNTILATREFERRMRAIHKTCDESLLDLYTQNINQPLFYIDSLAVKKGHKNFESFFGERVGAMDLDNAHLEGLKKFYENGIQQLRADLKKERKKEREKEKAWDEKVGDERRKESTRKSSREAQAYAEEVNLNHKRVSRQLGFTQGFVLTRNVVIVNIDREVYAATRNRKTTDVSFDGKTSTIKYNDFSFTVENHENYERLYAYLLPDKLNSYQRIQHKNGKFDYPLNNEITYDIVVLGMNESRFYYHEVNQINEGSLGKINLKTISEIDFEKRISQLNENRLDAPMQIADELNWLKLERKNYQVQKQRQAKRAFLERMRRVVFPCYEGVTVSSLNGTRDEIEEIGL
jgi:hypothetical protein